MVMALTTIIHVSYLRDNINFVSLINILLATCPVLKDAVEYHHQECSVDLYME